MFNSLTLAAIDLAAMAVLVYGVYYPRYRRGDLVVAFLGVNVGVLGVATVLAATDVGAGIGMGLFGVLSIIRLRSTEISQREVAYFFAALALGLVCGVASAPALAGGVAVLIVATLAIADGAMKTTDSQQVVVDRAIADVDELTERVEALTGASVAHLEVLKLDTVNDTTLVDAQFRPSKMSNLPVGV